MRGRALAGHWPGQAVELCVAAPAGEYLAVIVRTADGSILGAARMAAPQS